MQISDQWQLGVSVKHNRESIFKNHIFSIKVLDILLIRGDDDTVTTAFVTILLSHCTPHLFFLLLIYSAGRHKTLDAVSTCTFSWQPAVFEEWEEPTSCHSCVSPALLWHISEMQYLTNFLCPSPDEGRTGLWATDRLPEDTSILGASKLTESLFEKWHEDKWAQASCSARCITDIILPSMISHHMFYYRAIYLSLLCCRRWAFLGASYCLHSASFCWQGDDILQFEISFQFSECGLKVLKVIQGYIGTSAMLSNDSCVSGLICRAQRGGHHQIL